MHYARSLFLFRRDLRLADNTALAAALQQSDQVYTAFIFDPRQVEAHPYRSLNALQFLTSSLRELQVEIEKRGGALQFFYAQPERIVPEIMRAAHLEALYFNADYTPFSKKRDQALAETLQRQDIACHPHHDLLLHAPGVVLKDDGKPYTVFTPFYKRAQRLTVPAPTKIIPGKFLSTALPLSNLEHLEVVTPKFNPALRVHGGRSEALAILKRMTDFKNYHEDRDLPALSRTTTLSAHHKFGTVSIRESYDCIRAAFGEQHDLIRELYWRDFFTLIGHYFPHVFERAFHTRYDALAWDEPGDRFYHWAAGKTGFPIVDAGMRELNSSGFMHNRVRMIVASFLTKDLHIDWRLGERYFASKLVDYDPAVNNGSWQWAASTGCDAQPYFRIFNPWLQQKRFDPECVYIKRWIPELTEVTAEIIHNGDKARISSSYPAPMVVHAEEKVVAEAMYSDCQK
jgi:deoxyribodipyrimidine photo-lyase